MKRAELCPVCQGSGKIRPENPAHPNFGIELSSAVAYLDMPCHGCAEYGSKGWIVIGEDDPPVEITGSGDTFIIPSAWTEPVTLPDYTITTWPDGGDYAIITDGANQ